MTTRPSADTAFVSADPQTPLELVLEQLEEEERLLSAERLRLQDRIDYFADVDDSELVTQLEERERELSSRRRRLHEQIDGLRGDGAEPL